MPYELVKAMKIQTADGKIELRQAGAPCPEADTWPNPAVWIKRGFIRPTDHETALKSGYARDRLKPMVPAGPAATARALSHVPAPGKPLPGVVPTVKQIMAAGYDERNAHIIFAREQALAHGDGANESEKAGQLAGEAWDAQPLPPALDEDQDTISELKRMHREDLEKLATEHGIKDATSYPNKGELAKAILAKVKPASSDASSGETSSDAPSGETSSDAPPADTSADGGDLLAELMALDRSELNELAVEQGIEDAASLEHEAVAKAILAVLEAAG